MLKRRFFTFAFSSRVLYEHYFDLFTGLSSSCCHSMSWQNICWKKFWISAFQGVELSSFVGDSTWQTHLPLHVIYFNAITRTSLRQRHFQSKLLSGALVGTLVSAKDGQTRALVLYKRRTREQSLEKMWHRQRKGALLPTTGS